MAKILLIEDDHRIRELVCEHLASEGHSVLSEATGMKGLQKASKTHAKQAKTLKGVLHGGSKKRNGKKA